MELLGYLSAILIGLILGLIGGGGSILTVPVLVYLFHIHPSLGTGYSLFIVGSTSLFGVVTKWKEKEVDVKTALLFGLPSMLAVFLIRKWILPQIPDPMFSFGDFELTKSTFMMMLFALLMLFAALKMLRPVKEELNHFEHIARHSFSLAWQGFMVGSLTGFVGVGGGFLIVPALVMFSKLPMKLAIGTSLLIISVNSLVGFTGDVWNQGDLINWTFLGLISSLSVIGILIGGQLAKRLETKYLRKGFAWFVFGMSIFILIKELFIH